MQCACGKTFARRNALLRHKRESCTLRNSSLSLELNSPPAKRRRVEDQPPKFTLVCPDCPHDIEKTINEDHLSYEELTSNEPSETLITEQKPYNDTEIYIEKISSAFKCRIASYRITTAKNHIDHRDFFKNIEGGVIRMLELYREEYASLKINCVLFSIYVIPSKELSDLKSFNTKNRVLTQSVIVNDLYKDFQNEIMAKADKIQERNSGWTLQEIMYLEVNINKYNPLNASSYIPLPKQIAMKKAVVNIKNSDNKCFAYSVMAALFPAENNPHEPSSYPDYSTFLNFEGIEFPVKISDILKFEALNSNLSINCFGLKTSFKDGEVIHDIVGPLHLTKNVRNVHINLLYLSDNNGNNHYCLIKNLSRLVSSQKSRHEHRSYICNGCLQFFRSPEHLSEHEQNDCTFVSSKLPTNKPIKNKLGDTLPENILKFVNVQKQLPVPFVIYADFESLLKPIHHNEPKDDKSFTVKTYEHIPYSFCFYIKCNFNDSYSKLVHYKGLDAPQKFIESLEQHVVEIYNNHLKHIKPMLPLNKQQEEDFRKAKVCHICGKPFSSEDVKVKDHNHEDSSYRGAAHSICNLQYKTPKFIPVVFHNLTNYDCHLFIKKLALNKEKVDVIAQTKEKYITFGKYICVEKGDKWKDSVYIKLKFIDSLRFLPSSLDKLSQTLEDNQCYEIKKYFNDPEQFRQIRQKGVFPYSYMDSIEKLSETKYPPHEEFYDVLRGESVPLDNYQRGKYVWDLFNCQNLGDYSDLYIKSDVLLLTDVFENFRKVCLTAYKLDPAQYITAPSLSWDAMLRYTGVELELLTDIDMLHFFKKGIRGGITQCSKRAVQANNKYVPDYDDSKPNNYIMYLDATNLYGYAMSQYLPHSGFRWLTNEEIDNLDCTVVGDDVEKGYILEVDLEYPKELHDLHNELPFCAENLVPPTGKHPKLLTTLSDKKRYIIHYRNLKQCLKHGLKLKKVHRVIEFKQSPWLKPYIDINTQFRNSAKNAFEKDLFKYIINSIFGKTMENVEKRQDIKLKSHWKSVRGSVGAEALISQPNFKSVSVFSENLVAIQMAPLQVAYDKPLYVGFSILDISKSKMYSFYYDYIKPKYGERATLCYTDTDSQILDIQTDNVYDDIRNNIGWFDTSNYPQNNIHDMPKTVSVVGKMKDEYAGKVIHGFYGTGAKAYCVELEGKASKKAKGVKKNIVENELTVNDYKNIVMNGGQIFKKMYVFKSTLHNMYTELKNKVALSVADDKRFIFGDGVNSLAWGHYRLQSTPEENLDLLLTYAHELLNENKSGEDSNDCKFYINNFDDSLLTT